MVFLARVSLLLVPLLGTLSHAIQAEDYPSTCIDACDGITPDPNNATEASFYCDYCICNNKLLGWSNFQPPENFTDMFTDWVPLGGLCPKDWLCTWANWTDNGFNANYSKLVYAPNNGFNGCPKTVTLEVGTLVDRFGTENGSYLARAGTTYGERSIGPSSLNKYSGSTQYNYWRFIVTEEFEAQGGLILPWDSQPGGGWQWYVKGGLGPLQDAGKLKLVGADTFGVNEAWEAAEPMERVYTLQDQ
ncbi:hypothetical protein AAWM_01434 [Aspergillus awamori]|uniref:TNT domain-containing protein n=1 Tax=Aspergillus awamori TaxID=105351 RepID=A0A401KH69_ASPAW|nr:hypothetical protein AAWM_01434 [Aspergillus awamori]GKZ54392.1 hypothetical protein AnigIFM49718_009798 [Aspergillus niger]